MPKPVIDRSKCKDCSLCVDICPLQIFEKDGKEVKIARGGCIGCKSCEMQCPNSAIIVEED